MKVDIESRPRAGGAEVLVAGDVDLESSPDLLATLHKAMPRSGRLVVDLAGVTYIDSSGVAVLIQALKQAGRRGAGFVLRDPSARVLAVLAMAQLDRLFEIERTPNDRS